MTTVAAEIAFELYLNDREVLHVGRNEDLAGRIGLLMGRDTLDRMLPVTYPEEGIQVRGFVGKPLPESTYPVFRALLARGVAGLHELAERLGYQPNREFAGECDLCADLHAFLVAQEPGRFAELAPVESYTVDR